MPEVQSPMLESFIAARRVSTPIVSIATPDPAATIHDVRLTLKEEHPVLAWDTVNGLRGLNDWGSNAMSALGVDQRQTVNLVSALSLMDKLPATTAVFVHNAHKFFDNVGVLQGIWNLRDVFKQNKRTLVLLGPYMKLPPELANDIVALDEPLPSRTELDPLVDRQHKNAGLPLPSPEIKRHVLDAVVGLSLYTAESVIAMSLRGRKEAKERGLEPGIDIDRCWERKISAIQNTDGLRVWRGKESFDDLKGIDAAADYMNRLINAAAFGAIVFIDEMEKAFAGALSQHSGDSGVSKDQIGVILSYMSDTKSLGVLFAGLAGSGKTQLAKATARQAGKPLIVFDLGGMKAGVVGSSEARIRAALKVVSATAEGRVLFLATANQTSSFTPELNRRFRKQFFFDLPDAAGRAAMWSVYAKKCNLTPAQLKAPEGFDVGWTGAEIEAVAMDAEMFKLNVHDASKFMVPQCVSERDTIERLRKEATGRFLSASRVGPYRSPTDDELAPLKKFQGRAIDLES
jgi:hypothetical protein